jgi:hypothetical protein
MGARVNFVFADTSSAWPVLYSHWGADSWREDLAQALKHAEPRWNDESYCARVIISQLTKNHADDVTGFGIYAITPDEVDSICDLPVLVNVSANTVDGVSFGVFIKETEQILKLGGM